MNYVSVKPIKNIEVDTFVEDCKLFAVFDVPANVLFPKNLVNNNLNAVFYLKNIILMIVVIFIK